MTQKFHHMSIVYRDGEPLGKSTSGLNNFSVDEIYRLKYIILSIGKYKLFTKINCTQPFST